MCELRAIERFPMRGSPYPDESFIGFIVRLTDENGYDRPRWIITLANILWHSQETLGCFFDSRTNYSKLAELSYTSPKNIRRTTYPMLAGSKYHALCEFMGRRVPRKAINWKHAKVCPECLREQPYLRKIWDIALVTTCVKHECFLIDKCPKCDLMLHALRPKISGCSCGLDLSTIQSSLASPDDLFVTRLVWKCCKLTTERLEKAYRNNVLSALDLEELINSLSIAIDLRPNAPPKSLGRTFLTRLGISDLHQLVMDGVGRFLNWPLNFESLLEKHLDPASRNGDVSITRAPKLIQSLARVLLNKRRGTGGELGKLSLVRSAFANFICLSRGGVYSSRLRLKPHADIDEKYMGRTQAGELIGKDHRFISELIRNGIVASRTFCVGKHSRIVIERTSILSYKERLAQSLTRRAAALRIGINVRQINHLVTAKLLNPLCGPGICGQADWRFDAKQVDALLTKLFACAERPSCDEVEGWIDLHGAVRQVRTEKMLLPQLLESIIVGDLRSRMAGHNDGIARLQVSTEDLIRIKHERSDCRLPNVFSTTRAARILGIRPEQVREFIRFGYLGSAVEKTSRASAYRISLHDIETFQKKYIFPHELSDQLGVTQITLSHLIILAGITPVSGPGINGTRYLFTRSEVEKGKHKFLRSKQAQSLLRSSARTRERLSKQPKNDAEKIKCKLVKNIDRNSIELRRQIVAEVDKGKMSRQDIASQYSVTTEFVRRLIKQRDKEGSLEPKECTRFMSSIDKNVILEIVTNDPSITLTAVVKAIHTSTGKSVSVNCVSQALIKLGIPRSNIYRKRTGRPKKIQFELPRGPMTVEQTCSV